MSIDCCKVATNRSSCFGCHFPFSCEKPSRFVVTRYGVFEATKKLHCETPSSRGFARAFGPPSCENFHVRPPARNKRPTYVSNDNMNNSGNLNVTTKMKTTQMASKDENNHWKMMTRMTTHAAAATAPAAAATATATATTATTAATTTTTKTEVPVSS